MKDSVGLRTIQERRRISSIAEKLIFTFHWSFYLWIKLHHSNAWITLLEKCVEQRKRRLQKLGWKRGALRNVLSSNCELSWECLASIILLGFWDCRIMYTKLMGEADSSRMAQENITSSFVHLQLLDWGCWTVYMTPAFCRWWLSWDA